MTGRERQSRVDPGSAARRAAAADQGDDPYARERRRQARRRAAQERARFDPRPPDDGDWTMPAEEGDGLTRLQAPESVGDALGRLAGRRGWGERLGAATLAARWSEVVGESVAARCEPVRLAGGCLVVRAENQAWAAQLRYLQASLRDNAARVLAPQPVDEIRIVVGPLERR